MVWWFAVIAGCGAEEPVPDVFDPGAWQFPSEVQHQRYTDTRAELATRFSAGTHLELERIGNFLRETWCPNAGLVDACRAARVDRATLAVLHAPARYPEVFGLVLDINERRDGLAADLHWSLDGKTITGDSLVLRLATPDGEVTLGDQLTYTVGENGITVSAGPPAEVLAALLAPPDGLEQRGGALLRELGQQVVARIAAGEVRRCEYGEPPGNGRPPECTLVPLTPGEQALEQQRVEAWVAGQSALLTSHGSGLRELLRSVVPRALVP